MALSDIVNVTITKTGAAVSRVGFGIPLILTYHTKFVPRVKSYATAASMLTANGGDFASTDLAYILANAAFSQSPSPDRVLVGRRVSPTIRTVKYTPLSGTIAGELFPKNLTEYSITIARDGVEETFDYTSDASATVAEITLGLVTAINLGGVDVLATDNGTDLDIEAAASPGGAATAGTAFQVSSDKRLMAIVDETPAAVGETLADEIAAAINADDSWYCLIGDFWGKIELEDAALAIESLRKIHIGATADDDCYDSVVTTDTISALQTLNLFRSSTFYHEKPELGIAAAYAGKNLPKDPGSITWKFKTLAGQATSDLAQGELDALAAKNGERYISLAGISMTCDGKMASGEFIDITRGVDFMQARLEEDVFGLLVANDKVPFTDPGIAQVEGAVRGVLNQSVGQGILSEDPEFTVTVPKAADVSTVDKSNRLLPDVKFTGTLAGAIHEVDIDGTVSV